MVLAAFIFVLFKRLYICTHTHPFNGPLSGNTQVSRYQEGKTNRDFTEARDSERQWHQLGQRFSNWGPRTKGGSRRGPREDSEK